MTTQTTISEAAESLALALDCPHYKDVIDVHLRKWGNAKLEEAIKVFLFVDGQQKQIEDLSKLKD